LKWNLKCGSVKEPVNMKKPDTPILYKTKHHRPSAIILFISFIFSGIILIGCTNLLEFDREIRTEHQSAPYVRPPIEHITVSNYDELITTILGFIMEHETEFLFLYHQDEGEDVQAEVLRAINEIQYEHPIGAYAVAGISAETTRIVTHFEVEIEVEYKRTRDQLESIISVSTERAIQLHLLANMSEYKEEVVFRTRLQIDENIITELVRNTYYENPRQIVMLPIVTVETFPEEGPDRIYEISFGNIESPMMLQRFGELLTIYVQRNAELATGNTNSEIILSLVERLKESTTFNEGAARTVHVHGAQNLAATAFGALVRGNAVGEGFAMAFKALADELSIYCQIVLGYHDGMIHAWNIISLYGNYYHVDVAMCVVNSIENAFLKTDDDFEEMNYTWDRENTVICAGELTLDDILGLGETGEPIAPNDESDDESDNEEDD